MFRLFAIDLKKKKRHKNIAKTATQFDTIRPSGRAAKLSVQVVDSRETSSSILVGGLTAT